MVLIRKWRYKVIALLELAPWCVTGNPYDTIVTLAAYGKQKCSNSMSTSLSMSLSMSVSMSLSMSVSISVSVGVSVPCLFPCPVSVNESVSIKYGATNIFLWRGNYSVNFQGPYEVAQKLKGPLTWEGTDRIRWKSWRLFLKERPIGWYHFQPNKSRWTVPLSQKSR